MERKALVTMLGYHVGPTEAGCKAVPVKNVPKLLSMALDTKIQNMSHEALLAIPH
jgi:hypothetical protein